MVLILATFERTFNFAKSSAVYESAAGRYSAFVYDILAEMAKPSRERRDGTTFLKDVNLDRRRIEEQVPSIPWIVNKLYQRKYEKNEDATPSPQPEGNGGATFIFSNDIPRPPGIETVERITAARVIQKAWFRHICSKDKPTPVEERCIQKRKLRDLYTIANVNVRHIHQRNEKLKSEMLIPERPRLVGLPKQSPFTTKREVEKRRFENNLGTGSGGGSDDGKMSDEQLLNLSYALIKR
jgi:hypothetical protein